MNKIRRFSPCTVAVASVASLVLLAPLTSHAQDPPIFHTVFEHLTGEADVALPILKKFAVTSGADDTWDGSSTMDSYGGFVRYDGARLLLGIRENGINETDPEHDADMAAKFPDRSLIWIDARSGIPTGVALNFGLDPALPAGAEVVDGTGNYYFNFDSADDGVVFIGYRNLILRYAPEGDGFAAPTVAYTHEDDGSDQYNNWRWETVRARGAGADTLLSAGGKTWRARQQAYSFTTEDGMTFELDGYAPLQGGSSHVVPSVFEGEDEVEWIFGSIYPGSDSGLGTGIVKTVRDLEFDVDFSRENFPAEEDFEGEYTPRFVSDVDVHPEFPAVVSYSTPSWNSLAVVGGEYRPGWIAVHDHDGFLLFAHKLDVTEEAEFISDPDYQSAQWHGTLGAVSVNVVPGMEPGTAEILWYGGIYGYGRYLYGTTEDPSASAEPIIEVLGTGPESLLGGDLTNPGDDGDETDPDSPSWGWKSISANNEPGFNGAELSYNIFDNQVAGGDAKWCCDDATAENPLNVTVEFETQVSLTHFTITSGNDTPERDPIRFQIQGSNDGETFSPIFVRDSDEPLWNDRLQVVKVTLAEPSALYSFIRYEVTDTAGPNHQLTEIEYFGTFGGTNLARVSGLDRSLESVSIRITDGDDTTLEEDSVLLLVDGEQVTPVISKVDDVTTVTYTPAEPFAPSSVHTYTLTAEDSAGNDIESTGTFTMPTPLMPLEGVNGPDGADGVWGFRQIWNGGNVGSLGAALGILADPVAAGAEVSDTTVTTIDFVETTNPGNGGIIIEDLPLPAEEEGLAPDDFIIVGKASFTVAETGEYTIGCHSDDGFGLILMGGAEFTSENGGGRIDSNFPNILAHPGVTGDSNTRGVVTLQAGTVYGIQVVGYERGGGASFEFYAAKGAFELDEDTNDWFAIGDPDGPLQLVGGSGAPFEITDITYNGTTVVVTWPSKEGEGFVLERSTDFVDWAEAADGVPSGGDTTSFTFEEVTGKEEYYRATRE